MLADHLGLKLIEDCAQAHGATLNGRPVGGFGDAAAFSFCTDKIISTGGEGGMLVLRDAEVARRAWSLKDHGKDHDAVHTPSQGHGFRWLHRHFGSNYRLTEMQAAIGLAQLDHLANRSRRAGIMPPPSCPNWPGSPALRLIRPQDEIGHAYYKFYTFLYPEALKPHWTRDRIVDEAWRRGIPCQTGICPEIYRERAFIDARLGPESAPPGRPPARRDEPHAAGRSHSGRAHLPGDGTHPACGRRRGEPLTMADPTLPRFMVVGAVKAATTWIGHQLRNHPALWLPKAEPHFFSSEYHRGLDWYRLLFTDAPAGRIIGEKSADYLAHPDAAARIAATLPGVPLIIQLAIPSSGPIRIIA